MKPGYAASGVVRLQVMRTGSREPLFSLWNLERETSLELATSTLARLRSTN